METTLFVYGSLYRGKIHYSLISDFVESSTTAFVKGTIYRLEVGYPAYLNQGETSIPGEMVTLKNTETLLPILDQFYGFSALVPEKSLYIRHPITVQLNDCSLVQTHIYSINPKKLSKSAKMIENGDWISNLQNNPPCTEALNEREKTYISKLGQCTGRDIVPIQLDLYRNLMNQGIIVDKGRRLALSRFGQEICRYLK